MEYNKYAITTNLKPAGSQINAIKELTTGVRDNHKAQTLLGVTGSGKLLR